MKPSIILMILFVLLVLLYVYNNSLDGFALEGFASAKTLVICKADWCGHCKKAAPEFDKLMSASPITLKDGSKVNVTILDADKDKEELSKYKIKGFPTILVVDGSNTTEYPGERTSDGVIEFLNSNY